MSKNPKSKIAIPSSHRSLMMMALLPVSLALVACQTSLPADISSNLSTTSSVIPAGSLAVSSPATTVNAGSTVTIAAAGGTAPYSYFITGASNSSINSTSGVFTAGLAAETVQILVQDATGMTSLTTIQVLASTTATVNIFRSFSSASGDHLYSRDSGEGPRAGYINEGAVFSVYATQMNGTTALNRCSNPTTGIHMLSLAANCEGQTLEGPIGYVAITASNTTTLQLYRFAMGLASGAVLRFATLSVNEGSSAGFTLEGPIGYVAPAVP